MGHESLVLIADAARARMFAAHRAGPWQLLKVLEYPRGAAREGDLLTDRPGRVQQSIADGRRAAAEPKTSAHEVEAQRFARQLAEALDHAVAGRQPQRVVLVAPPRFLGYLRESISGPVRALLGASLDHDLSQLPERELPARLADLL